MDSSCLKCSDDGHAVVVAGGFEADDHRPTEIAQGSDQAIVFRPIVQNAQSTAPHSSAGVNKDWPVPGLEDGELS